MKYLHVILPFLICLLSCRNNTPHIEKVSLSLIKVPKPEEEYLATGKIRYRECHNDFTTTKYIYNSSGKEVKVSGGFFCGNRVPRISILYYNDYLNHNLYTLRMSFPRKREDAEIYSLTQSQYGGDGLIYSSITYNGNWFHYSTFEYNENKHLVSELGFTYEYNAPLMPKLVTWGTTDITYHYHKNVLDSIVHNGRKLPTAQSKFVQVCDATGIVVAIINDHSKTMVRNYTAIPQTEDITLFRSIY